MTKKSRRRRGLLFVAIALAIAFASTWVNKTWISYQDNKNNGDQQNRISHYFTDFTVTENDVNGLLKYKLTGKHLSHWSSSEISEVTKPHVITYHDEKPASDMLAKQAIIKDKDNMLELRGSVIIKNLQSEPISILTTDFLRYYPNEKWVNTESRVKFVSGKTLLMGKGMDSKLDDNKLRIHADVYSTFEKE